MSDTILQFLGNKNPSLTYTVESNDVPQDLTGCTVHFRMRPVGQATLKVDAAASVVTPAAGTLRYDWASTDVDTAGFYLGWFQITYPSAKTQDTPEFLLEVRDHTTASMLCDLFDVRLAMETPVYSDGLDARIQALIPDATREISDEALREFTPTTGATRRFDVRGFFVDLQPYDLRTVTSIRFDPDDTNVLLQAHVDYELLPVGGNRDGTYTGVKLSQFLPLNTVKMANFGHGDLSITGDWGFATVPAPIREAAVVAIRSWVRVNTETYAQNDPERQLQPTPYGTYKLPSASLAKIDPYRRFPRGMAL